MTDTLTKPLLIIVTGRPGAGKSTLAHALARAVRCPAICRDEIKEGFVNTVGSAGDAGDTVGRDVYEIFFDTLTLLLNRRISVVAEAAFQHKRWAPKLDPLRELARIRIILCQVDPELARTRRIERALADPGRAPFHGERAAAGDDPPISVYDPPRMEAPTLIVDTSDGYQPPLERIVSFART